MATMVSHSTPLLYQESSPATDNTSIIEHGYVPIKLFMDAEICISHNFLHVTKHYSSFKFFFQPCIIVKAGLSSELHENKLSVRFGSSHRLPNLGLETLPHLRKAKTDTPRRHIWDMWFMFLKRHRELHSTKTYSKKRRYKILFSLNQLEENVLLLHQNVVG